MPLSCEQLRAIESKRLDLNEDLADLRCRDGPLFNLENVGCTWFVDDRGLHGSHIITPFRRVARCPDRSPPWPEGPPNTRCCSLSCEGPVGSLAVFQVVSQE